MLNFEHYLALIWRWILGFLTSNYSWKSTYLFAWFYNFPLNDNLEVIHFNVGFSLTMPYVKLHCWMAIYNFFPLLIEGCGFVKYSHRDMALAAINALNGIFTMRVRNIIPVSILNSVLIM